MQRANPDAVSSKKDGSLCEVDEHECELSVELFEHVLPMLLIKMHDCLGVGVGAEDMALSFERPFSLRVVEEFTIEYDRKGAVLIENRLATIEQADNRKPPLAQAEPRRKQVTVFVRTPVPQGFGHALNRRTVRLERPAEINDPCYSTHLSLCPNCERADEARSAQIFHREATSRENLCLHHFHPPVTQAPVAHPALSIRSRPSRTYVGRADLGD